jgi:hypothetical protein
MAAAAEPADRSTGEAGGSADGGVAWVDGKSSPGFSVPLHAAASSVTTRRKERIRVT